MNSPVPPSADKSDVDAKSDGDNNAELNKKPLSRMESLKLKIKKLQGKDPDIYPMW
jgi:hypothetical protein